MLIPIKDDNPLVSVRFQFVTVSIIALNIFVFLFVQGAVLGEISNAQALGLGYVPAVFFDHAELAPDLYILPSGATLVSYMFLHGSWMHIISNMLFLWVFGDNVEDTLGHFLFLVFYLFCGVTSALLHGWAVSESQNPLIGASGAIAGVIGAYLILFPDRKVWVLLFFGVPLKIPALVVLGFWIATQIFSLAAGAYGDTEVAWIAHIAGFFVGAVLIFAVRGRVRRTMSDPEA